MQWMIETQLGRRNLTDTQRIAVAKKYEDSLRARAKDNLEQAGKNYGIGIEKPLSTLTNPIAKTNTREEIAKIANVSTGTLAKYDYVLKSDYEDIKEKMLSEEYTINKAYTEVKAREKEKVVEVADEICIDNF